MRILGIDASTRKFAYGIVNDGELESYGEIFYQEKDMHKRYAEIRKVVEDILPHLGVIDYIGFERAIMAKSTDTALKMAHSFGIVLSVLAELDVKMVEIAPISWQSWAGNPVISGEKKRQLLLKHPEVKTVSQKSTFIRKYRKQKTMDFVEKETGVKVDNDDLGDAICIALFTYDKAKELGF